MLMYFIMGCTSSQQIEHDIAYKALHETFENTCDLLKCNANTLTWIKFALLKANLNLKPSPKDISIFPEKCKHPTVIKKLGFDFLLNEDLKNEIGDKLQNLLFGGVVNTINSTSFTDNLFYYDGENDPEQIVKRVFDGALPRTKINWNDWNSNQTLTNLAFNGLGQYYLQACDKIDLQLFPNSKYKIDLTSWGKYSVRKGFEGYGIVAYFDQSKNPTMFVHNKKIYYNGYPSFHHANLIFKSALITAITLKEHLVMIHWIISNGVLVSSMKTLNKNHPIRRFLRIHTYGTSAVNLSSITVLAPFDGLAGRTFAFDKHSWSTMIKDQIYNCKYQTIKEQFEETKLQSDEMEHLPYYKDGIAFWNINEKYVKEFINIFYDNDLNLFEDKELCDYWKCLASYHSTKNYNIGTLNKDNLIKHLTYVIFNVSGQHEYLGSVCEYLLSPCGLMPKISSDPSVTVADIQTHLQALCIISLTTGKMPMLLDDIDYIYNYQELKQNKNKYNLVMNNLGRWQRDLAELSKLINLNNSQRTFPFCSFDPANMESSVSV